MTTIDERSKKDFLTYANAVIKSRAVPYVEDNLKPIHRKILYTLWENKFGADKPAVKSVKVVGLAMGYHPHGDASIYGALVRMSQWWKLRYPLVEMQGNCGNILGDGAAASRYTNCRLSKIGELMVEELKDKRCVEFKPNHDETAEEPVTLPSKFPFLLCGNNSGIAVGLASDLVSHNFTEISEAIKYYLDNQDCSIADLMKIVPGPDFPTGGQIVNGEDLLNIYTTGRGGIKMRSHYTISKKGKQTVLTFHDLPYGVEIDSNIKAPLKKLVIEDGYTAFENIDTIKTGPQSFDIVITLNKDANVGECLNLLWNKTGLEHTVKVNQMLIINGQPTVLNFKQLIQYWVNYRSGIIRKVASSDLTKTNHKLTITIGLLKCMSDISRVIEIVRFDDNPKATLMKEFELNDEQASAVLDIKLARLSKLEVEKLKQDEEKLRNEIEDLKDIVEHESRRFNIIKQDLDAIKKMLGTDKRMTEILYKAPIEDSQPVIKKEYKIYSDGLHISYDGVDKIDNNLVDIVYSYNSEQIIGYNALGEMSPIINSCNNIGAFVNEKNKNKLVSVTKNGNIKVSALSEYKLTKANEKIMKIKDDDSLVYANTCSDDDFLILYNGERNVLKLAIKDLTTASKLTVGVKSGFNNIVSVAIVKDGDELLITSSDGKGKITAAKDFSIDSRGNKGQLINENANLVKLFDKGREMIYIIPERGNVISVNRNKISVKSKTASGASLTLKKIVKII